MLLLRSQRGFTAIELLVVVALLVIIASIAIINVNRLIAQNNLQSATTQLATDIRTMQQLSMEKSRQDSNDQVNITFSGNSYRIVTNKTTGTSLPARTLPNGITVGSSTGNALSFDAVDLTQNTTPAKVTLTSTALTANNIRTIVIAKTTGRIRIASSANSAYVTGEE